MEKKKCPYCNKAGWRECNECEGRGYLKSINPISISIFGKAVVENDICKKCNGKGKIPCNVCKGVGWL